ncbi:MAG: hypothetical protein LBP22_14550 [Deltaproteobacteria bacterium]|jgi:hypothetical protein|nr:hypothetical protein [Deltaproteobacteria bacterium]
MTRNEKKTLPVRGVNRSDCLWSETLAACQECLDLDRRFAAELERQIAGPDLDPLEPALWESFVEARRDLFDFTAVNLTLLAKTGPKSAEGNNVDEGESKEGSFSQVRGELLKSLAEMVALEEKLTAYLSENLGILKETIDDLSKSQAIFAGYASLDTKPSAIKLDSLA